jgi:hypothetical protein
MCCDWLWVSLDSGRQKRKMIAGCRGSEHVKERKTLVSQKVYTCCIIHWPRAHAGCSEPGHVHTRVALLTGHVPVDRLISVEDCCLISVGVEGVS